MRLIHGIVLGLAAAVTATSLSCVEPREGPARPTNDDEACLGCHGSASNATSRVAPPGDLHGKTAVSARGVGAHQLHLGAGPSHGPLTCETCHVVPSSVDAAGHSDTARPAEVILSNVGAKSPAAARYDYATWRCETYCHGVQPSQRWNAPRTTEEACGSCHGLPPAWPHPQSEECTICHTTSAVRGGAFTAPELHVNGTVEHEKPACDACHGAGEQGAPPPSLVDGMNASDPAVGAHTTHLAGRGRSRAVPCTECHVVPTEPVDTLHPNGGRAEVRFTGAAARATSDTPGYDSDTRTCSTWCHTAGGTTSAPTWTGAELACDGCHGSPPPAPHPPSTQCFACHTNALPDGGFVDASQHVDGVVQVTPATTCTSCHGSGTNPAPPKDLAGNVDSSLPGVGAHLAHLEGRALARPVPCEECHVVPVTNLTANHPNGGQATVAFTGVAAHDTRTTASPSYDEGARSCTTWCHGVGTSTTSPAWTSGPLGCDGCHGTPPPAPHTVIDQCFACHPNALPEGGFVDETLHVDGLVQVEMTNDCTACHGSGDEPAPPRDLAGNLSTSSPGVGAHRAHVQANGRTRTTACTDCHLVPAQTVAAGHVNGAVELAFSAFASSYGVTATYDGASCRNYCHSVGRIYDPQGGKVSPPWITSLDPVARCAMCHDLPPAAPHPDNGGCPGCHSNIDGYLEFADPSTHVNGLVDF